MIGIAGTGTGKTAAFLIPLIDKLSNDRTRREKFMVLAPTRELAEQIELEFEALLVTFDSSVSLVLEGLQSGDRCVSLNEG